MKAPRSKVRRTTVHSPSLEERIARIKHRLQLVHTGIEAIEMLGEEVAIEPGHAIDVAKGLLTACLKDIEAIWALPGQVLNTKTPTLKSIAG